MDLGLGNFDGFFHVTILFDCGLPSLLAIWSFRFMSFLLFLWVLRFVATENLLICRRGPPLPAALGCGQGQGGGCEAVCVLCVIYMTPVDTHVTTFRVCRHMSTHTCS